MTVRRESRAVKCGTLRIGGGAPVSVQSMANVPAYDFAGILTQVRALECAGCDLVRLAVPDEEAAGIFPFLRERGIHIPLSAAIHFDYKLALASLRAGADKIRINPGNIGAEWKVREVADACKEKNVPIRIGVNGGSLESELRRQYGGPTPQALAESALKQAEMLEKFGFSDIVISMKTSSVADTIETYRLAAGQCSYPLHVGVTEAGDAYSGLIKNAVGIGSLLADGIGDTLRISLTADPAEEVRAGRELLKILRMDGRGGVEIVSCPTCGRTKIDLVPIAARFKEAVNSVDTHGKRIKAAVMGCVVNGPGEARDADVGIAGGDGFAVLFRRGEVVGRVEEEDIIARLLAEVRKLAEEKTEGEK